ncbi:MAG TPA: hypothetical protein P5313_16310 [Spirochaetia bacterium]|nr:hypothetical protein [Spirochaetales bacterium]HRY81979.1 hypothetical protein [Spirochaetia bacterium]
MTSTRDFLRWYARSPLGMGAFVLSAAAGVGMGLAGVAVPAAVGIGAGAFLAASAAAFASGAGGRAAARERDRDLDASLAAGIAAAAKDRDRIAALRIRDAEVASASAAFALAFGEYLDACRREGTRDPQADDAARDVLAALTAYLRELDGTAVERRFDLPDADPFPEAKARTLAFLKERIAYVRERRLSVDGGLGGSDTLAIREELR